MEHINLANIEKFIEDHEQLSSFDIYYLGFVTKYTGQENLEAALGEISAYLELESEGFLALSDKLQGFITVLFAIVDDNSLLPEMNKEWLESNPEGTKENGLIEYFNQIYNIIKDCDGIMKVELYYIGNFHALDPSTQIETVFSSLQKLAKARATHTVAKRIEFVCNMFKNKLNSSQRLNILKFPNQKDRVKLESVKKEGTGIVFGLPKESKNPEILPPPPLTQVVTEQKEKQTNVKIESSNTTDTTAVPPPLITQASNPWYPPTQGRTNLGIFEGAITQAIPTTNTISSLPNTLNQIDIQSTLTQLKSNQVMTQEFVHANFLNDLLKSESSGKDLSSSTRSLTQKIVLNQQPLGNEKELSFGIQTSISSLNSGKNEQSKPESPKFPGNFPATQSKSLNSEVKEEAKDPENKLSLPKRIPDQLPVKNNIPTVDSSSSPPPRIKKIAVTNIKKQNLEETKSSLEPTQRVQSKSFVCFMCERVIERKNIFVVLESCQHVCCADCTEDARCFMHNQIQMRKLPLICPLENCHQEIQLSDLVNTLRGDDDIPEEYIKYTLETYIENHDNINCCPTAGCLYAFDKPFENKFTCPLCQKSYCLHCRVDWHEGSACSHRRVKEEDAIQIQRQVKSKKCPKCSYWVIKRQGYKCLICPYGHKFCYDCGAQREEDDCKCFGETNKTPIVNPALFHE